MKIFSITPKNDKGEVSGPTGYTVDHQDAVGCLAKGYEVKMADAFFHPVEIQLNRVRGSKVSVEEAVAGMTGDQS